MKGRDEDEDEEEDGKVIEWGRVIKWELRKWDDICGQYVLVNRIDDVGDDNVSMCYYY